MPLSLSSLAPENVRIAFSSLIIYCPLCQLKVPSDPRDKFSMYLLVSKCQFRRKDVIWLCDLSEVTELLDYRLLKKQYWCHESFHRRTAKRDLEAARLQKIVLFVYSVLSLLAPWEQDPTLCYDLWTQSGVKIHLHSSLEQLCWGFTTFLPLLCHMAQIWWLSWSRESRQGVWLPWCRGEIRAAPTERSEQQ